LKIITLIVLLGTHSQVLAESAVQFTQEQSLSHLGTSAFQKNALCGDPLALKDAGTEQFRLGQYAAALESYVTSLQAYLYETDVSTKQTKQTSTLSAQTLCTLLANCAQCHLGMGDYVGTVHCASTAVLMQVLPRHSGCGRYYYKCRTANKKLLK
jgi:hypothetical protein